jgi:hypothetical protein
MTVSWFHVFGYFWIYLLPLHVGFLVPNHAVRGLGGNHGLHGACVSSFNSFVIAQPLFSWWLGGNDGTLLHVAGVHIYYGHGIVRIVLHRLGVSNYQLTNNRVLLFNSVFVFTAAGLS